MPFVHFSTLPWKCNSPFSKAKFSWEFSQDIFKKPQVGYESQLLGSSGRGAFEATPDNMWDTMLGKQVSLGAPGLTRGCLGCSLGWKIAASWAVTVSHPLSVPEALLMTALYSPLTPPLHCIGLSGHGQWHLRGDFQWVTGVGPHNPACSASWPTKKWTPLACITTARPLLLGWIDISPNPLTKIKLSSVEFFVPSIWSLQDRGNLALLKNSKQSKTQCLQTNYNKQNRLAERHRLSCNQSFLQLTESLLHGRNAQTEKVQFIDLFCASLSLEVDPGL